MPTNELTPFRIDVPQADLDDLQRRLAATRWPDELPGVGWAYGVAGGHLRELVEHWRTRFDWRGVEARLNELPQVTTTIDGQRVHLAHVRSRREDATPLLMTHGWPSTVADFLPIVGPLTDPAAFGAPDAPAFHLVLPSLPGFGFSGPTTEPGWSITRIAAAWLELMDRLGFDRFLAQGGDTGSLVSPEIARLAADRVLGVHLNAEVTAGTIDWTADDPTAGLTEDEAGRLYALSAVWEGAAGLRHRAGDPTADPRLRPQRLTRRPARVGPGVVRRLRPDDDRADAGLSGRDPHRRHDDVVDRDRRLVGAHLQGRRRRLRRRAEQRCADRRGRVPGRPRHPDAVRAVAHDRAVDRVRPRGALRQPAAPDLLVEDLRAFAGQLAEAGTLPGSDG